MKQQIVSLSTGQTCIEVSNETPGNTVLHSEVFNSILSIRRHKKHMGKLDKLKPSGGGEGVIKIRH